MGDQVKLTHSYSSLDLFDSCPKRYYHLRVAKDIREEDGQASLDGQRDHEALEYRLKDGVALPPHLQKHEGTVRVILNSGLEVKPEQELAVTRELEPCDWWHKDAHVRAKVDVGLYGKAKAGLLDWKTGKRRPKSFQLELGALLQFLHYPNVMLTEAAFLWLRENATDKYTFTRQDDYARILSKLSEKIKRIEDTAASGVWQAKPGYHCNWCGAKDICSYSQARK